MTTDPSPEAVDIVERTIRDFGSIDAGNKPQRILAAYDILMALSALDSAKPLDGEAVERVAIALYGCDWYDDFAGQDDERKEHYRASARAALAAMPKDGRALEPSDACAKCGGAGEWRDGQTSGTCQVCHGSGSAQYGAGWDAAVRCALKDLSGAQLHVDESVPVGVKLSLSARQSAVDDLARILQGMLGGEVAL